MQIEILTNYADKDVFHRVKKDQSLGKIAKLYNVTIPYILEHNEITEEIEEGDYIYLPQTNLVCHIVQPMDTLAKIAGRYNVSVEHILKKNRIETLFIGQKLYI